MSSSVFFKFKSSKEPQRITFDGTGISVFELKREIIIVSGLGDGTDFDLAIYREDTNEEYDDDTTIIPRSTSVVARRLPAQRPGHGKAARYVSGKAPVNAKNTHRVESSLSKPAIQGKGPTTDGAAEMNIAQTEEERIAAMFKAGGDQWEQQQQQMANAKPVHRGFKGKPTNVPDHDPPPGYICYRCHEKGHWIQACPTNDDPNFENRPRIKRTTGIPRSFLKTVEKPVALAGDGLSDDSRQPSGVMVNAEGEYVIAEPDKASWEKFQAKAEASAAQQVAAASGSKELRDRGLECPLDKRMFVEPMKTPCCGKTYCNDCIENALVNSDLVCPNCSKEGVLIDDLVSDEEIIAKIKAYEEEKEAEKKPKEGSKSPKLSNGAIDVKSAESTTKVEPKPRSPSPAKSADQSPPQNKAVVSTDNASKKRSAEEDLKNDRIPTAPAAMRRQQEQLKQQQSSSNSAEQDFINQMNALAQNGLSSNQAPMQGQFPPFQSMNQMGFSAPNGMMNNMPMSMAPMMGMGNSMMNPMMMQQGGNWPAMGGMGMGGFPNQNMYGNFNNGPMGMEGGFNQPGMWQGNNPSWNGGMMPLNQNMQNGGKFGVFPNQQRTVFSEPFPSEEDNPYFRKPVNPHRHQNRQKRARPTDYTEL